MSEENNVVVEDQEQQVEQQHEENFEEEARLYGWVPQDEFRDSPDKWVDAKRFVERGREINPILRKNNEVLVRKYQDLSREMNELKGTIQDFKKYHEDTEKRSYEKALAELKAAKKEAINVGDGDRVIEIDDQIDDLKQMRKDPQPQAPQPNVEIPPELKAWQDSNPWYGQDVEMTAVTNAIGQVVASEGKVGADWLNEITVRIKKRFPEKFKKAPTVSSVEGSGSSGAVGRKGGKSYGDLPSDAKATCDKFVKQGLLTKEQYVKDYFGE